LKELHNDARYPGNLTIHYPLHPFCGQELPVSRQFGIGDALQFELRASDRRVFVPAWMTDPDRCRQLTSGCEPRCSMASLLKLVALLRTAGL
jgi:hypothetical protein